MGIRSCEYKSPRTNIAKKSRSQCSTPSSPTMRASTSTKVTGWRVTPTYWYLKFFIYSSQGFMKWKKPTIVGTLEGIPIKPEHEEKRVRLSHHIITLASPQKSLYTPLTLRVKLRRSNDNQFKSSFWKAVKRSSTQMGRNT